MSAAVLVIPEGSTHHHGVPAGMSAVELSNKKSLTTVKASNTVKEVKPSNTVKTVKPSNTVKTVKPSNSVKTVKPSNTVKTVKPSNTVKTVKPSNTVTTVKPSNTVKTVEPSNTLATVKPSNTLATVKPSGSAGYVPDWKKPRSGPRMCEAVSVNPENTGNYVSAFRRQFPFLLSTDPTLFPQDPKNGAGLWVTFPVDYIYTSYECSSHEKRVVWSSVQGHVDLAYRYNFPLRRGEVRVVWEFGQRCNTTCPWQKPRIDLSVAGWVLNKLCLHLRRNYYPASLTPSSGSGSTCSGQSLAGGSAWGRRQLANQEVRDHDTNNCEVCSYSWQCPKRKQCQVKPGEGTGQLEFIDWTFLDENDHVHML